MVDHTHDSGECWVPEFVAWAEGSTDTLDFDGKEVPERLQTLLKGLEPREHIVTVTSKGWNLMHPMECRPDLGACEFNDYAQSMMASHELPSPGETWRYRVFHRDGHPEDVVAEPYAGLDGHPGPALV